MRKLLVIACAVSLLSTAATAFAKSEATLAQAVMPVRIEPVELPSMLPVDLEQAKTDDTKKKEEQAKEDKKQADAKREKEQADNVKREKEQAEAERQRQKDAASHRDEPSTHPNNEPKKVENNNANSTPAPATINRTAPSNPPASPAAPAADQHQQNRGANNGIPASGGTPATSNPPANQQHQGNQGKTPANGANQNPNDRNRQSQGNNQSNNRNGQANPGNGSTGQAPNGGSSSGPVVTTPAPAPVTARPGTTPDGQHPKAPERAKPPVFRQPPAAGQTDHANQPGHPDNSTQPGRQPDHANPAPALHVPVPQTPVQKEELKKTVERVQTGRKEISVKDEHDRSIDDRVHKGIPPANHARDIDDFHRRIIRDDDRDWREVSRRDRDHDHDRNRYYWHEGYDDDFGHHHRWCNYWDDEDHLWVVVEVDGVYYPLRYDDGYEWTWDPYWGRWVRRYNGVWVYTNPTVVEETYVVNYNSDGNVQDYSRYDESEGSVVLQPDYTPPVETPPAYVPPVKMQSFISPDQAFVLQIIGDNDEAYLSDNSDQPAFSQVFLVDQVKKSRFVKNGKGVVTAIVLIRRDNSVAYFSTDRTREVLQTRDRKAYLYDTTDNPTISGKLLAQKVKNVTFSYDENGLLYVISVQATAVVKRKTRSVTIRFTADGDRADGVAMLRDSHGLRPQKSVSGSAAFRQLGGTLGFDSAGMGR